MSFVLAARAVLRPGIEAMAGELEAAERELAGVRAVEQIGENELRSTVARDARAGAHGQGRDDEAEQYADRSDEIAAADDVFSQVLWRGAGQGARAPRRRDAARELARQAVTLAAATDSLSLHGGRCSTWRAWRRSSAGARRAGARREAMELFERTGRRSLAALRPPFKFAGAVRLLDDGGTVAEPQV